MEEELIAVHPGTLLPCGGTEDLLERAGLSPEHVTGEVTDGVLELRTPVCDDAGEAVAILGALRAELGEVTPLVGAGVHPLARFGEVVLRGGERYELIDRSMRAIMRQTPHCGVHVHVGMPDGETAVRAANGMRGWIPLLQALGANSPYWYGQDSGLASTRSVICNSFPRSGIPRAFEDYADYATTVEELRALGECPDDSYLWWDLRPHPRLGTLEIRALDAQSSLEDLVALVALTHCLAVHEASTVKRRRLPGPEALRELSFRATRDGLEARLLSEGTLRPVREVALHAVAVASAYAADLGCWDELMLVHRLLERGNGAVRQRTNAAEGGVELMLRRLVDETARWRSVRAVTSAPEAVATAG
ncbi:YbdK family carboxylate-amine ligase [Solirubrobacter sp. CPCC 204708]|uniref:Putative glutamate--cysteine ligase 2 n=1 Tax=Solirubrobacter deserti TaxID=2282478 RepID=A0ABT4RDW3_9ACTN|nr:YbdK family carboxylate-amine ligase [Solirubrobacter deserti]MBE2315973.1 YbdK family carboxylate-amine ligase [Solirubrobacter deserti]MDA0136724.1 YbdK family carboxylate-amine ligase [Solirubrobacter deserti]